MEKIELIKNQVCEVTIGYKNKVSPKNRIKITDPDRAAEVVRALYDESIIEYQEQFHIIGLNNANSILCHKIISSGSEKATVVSVKAILQVLILSNSTSCIISHNHPSNSLIASNQDEALTQRIKSAAALIDVTLLDHIIITVDSYLSFKAEGLI